MRVGLKSPLAWRRQVEKQQERAGRYKEWFESAMVMVDHVPAGVAWSDPREGFRITYVNATGKAVLAQAGARAEAVGTGFDMNPSPGNIKDGLITDAMKSAGAVKKGGTSPVADVLDYPQYATKPGLNLLCTPGNDVEAVTGQVGAGANIVLFTTGLGTPTGNPIAPVIKLSTNTALANRMSDIIDFDCGTIVNGDETIQQSGEAILEFIIQVASGEKHTRAEMHHQDDFIPWKRGISL